MELSSTLIGLADGLSANVISCLLDQDQSLHYQQYGRHQHNTRGKLSFHQFSVKKTTLKYWHFPSVGEGSRLDALCLETIKQL